MAARRRSRQNRERMKRAGHTSRRVGLPKSRVHPPPPPAEPKGLQITSGKGALKIRINLTLRRKDAWLLILGACLVLLLLASSINEDIRSILVEALVGLLQVLIFGERKNR